MFRIISEYPAYDAMTNVIIGKNACQRISPESVISNGLLAVIPAEAAPETGNQCSVMAKIHRRIMPSQKKGIVHSSMETDIVAVSNLLPGREPLHTPNKIPSMAVMIVDTPTRKRVQGRYSIIAVNTGVG